MTGIAPDDKTRRRGRRSGADKRPVAGPAMVGVSAVAAGVAGVAVQQGLYVLGMVIIVVGGATATAAEVAIRRPARLRSRPDGVAGRRVKNAVIPDMLPADAPHFVGRIEELRCLSAVSETAGVADTIVISSIEGMGGIGKTSMAVHWAHSISDRFPDGQLYVDLRGFGPGDPVSPLEAMAAFLDAFGLKKSVGQSDLSVLRHTYLGLLWQKRVLIILDNARDKNQVEPLIPDVPGCVVIITSRNRMPDLANARTISLDLLSDAEARDLILDHIGPTAFQDSPGAVEDLIRMCGNLPLALTIVSATAATMPEVPLSRVLDQLRKSRKGVIRDTRQSGDGTPEFVFSWSYEQLSEPTAAAFRLLSCHPAAPFAARAAASMTAASDEDIAVVLGELSDKYLISQRLSGEYTFHDLVREYSGILRAASDDEQAVTGVVRRMVDYYVRSAYAAAAAINPLRKQIRLVAGSPGVRPESFRTFDDAAAWLDRHYLLLLEMIALASRAGLHDHSWQLAWAVGDSIDRNLHWGPLGAAMRTAHEAATRGRSRLGQAVTLRWLGRAQLKVGAYESARSHFLGALDLAKAAGDWNEQALCYHNLALLEEELERYEEALLLVRSALRMYRKAKDPSGEGRGINAVGYALTLLGRHAEAVELCQQALQALKQIGDRQGQADTLDSLGHAYYGLGDLASSEESYRQAVALFAEIGNLPAEASTLRYLGEVYIAMGSNERAAETWRHALRIKTDLSLPGTADLETRLAKLRTGGRWGRILVRSKRMRSFHGSP